MKKHSMKFFLKSLVALMLCLCMGGSALADVLKLPESLKVIEDEAFYEDTSLDEVVLPEGIEEIGERAFANSSLKTINLPDSMTNIGDNAFDHNSEIVFNANKESYAYHWLEENGYLSEEIPEAPTSDFNFADNGDGTCYVVRYNGQDAIVRIPGTNEDGLTVTSIGLGAFENCNNLTSAIIPDSVTSIGMWAFGHCRSLTSVAISDNVTYIGKYAFCDCTSLTSISIPSSVITIDDWAFEKCISLTSVSIPDGVTSIGGGAFNCCWSLTRVSIPDSVISIGSCAFGSSGLTSVSLPDSITSIDVEVFNCCSNLANVSIPDSVTCIGDGAFGHCKSLTSISIPDSVISIGSYAFGSSGLTSVRIPDSVTSIGREAFAETNLTSIRIPDSVTSLGARAFWTCYSLTSVSLPDSITSIEDDVFGNCMSLTSITIPDSVTYIGNNAFHHSALTSISLPDSVTYIGNDAFSSCWNLNSVSLPDSVTSIGDDAFWDCTSLTSITIPDNVTSIGDGAFCQCLNLKSIIIPGSVTSIGATAFLHCGSLTRIIISDSVTSIGQYAFECSYDARVYCVNPSTAWTWFTDNGYADNLISWDGSHSSLPENLQLSGGFIDHVITLTLGDPPVIPNGIVKSSGKDIYRVTLTISDWNQDGTNNNRYATYMCSELHTKKLKLTDWDAFYLDTTQKPLYFPGIYTINLWAGVKEGEGVKLDSMTVNVGWKSYLNSDWAETYETSTSDEPNGRVDNTNPVTVIMEENDRYYIQMILPEGETALRWVDKDCISKEITANQFITFCTGSDFVGQGEEVTSTKENGDIVSRTQYPLSPGTELQIPFITDVGAEEVTVKLCYWSDYDQRYYTYQIDGMEISAGTNEFQTDESGKTGNLTLTLPAEGQIQTGNYVLKLSSKNRFGETVDARVLIRIVVPMAITDVSFDSTIIIVGTELSFTVKAENATHVVLCFEGKEYNEYPVDDDGFVYASRTVYDAKNGIRKVSFIPRYETDYGQPTQDYDIYVLRYASVQGCLLDENEAPISNATIQFYCQNTWVDTATSDEQGNWQINQLEFGKTYQIIPEAPGYIFSPFQVQITQPEENIGNMYGQPDYNYLIANVCRLKVGPEANSAEIEILSDLSWTVYADKEWIHPSVDSGTGNATITLSIDENPADALRIGTLCLQTEDRSGEISIAQLGVTARRLSDPDITAPETDNMTMEYGPVTIEWTSVPDADHYVVSLRDLDSDILIVNHSVRSTQKELLTVLTPEYFTPGAHYRVAVGAVPKGFESSDSIVSWKERLFSISEIPPETETWLYGRVVTCDDYGTPIPVSAAALKIYLLDENDEVDDTAQLLGTGSSEDDGTWVFHNLESGKSYAVIVTEENQPVHQTYYSAESHTLKARSSTDVPLGTVAMESITQGGNNAGDITINSYEYAYGEHGLWAQFYNYNDKNAFNNESLRYIATVSNIDFTFTGGTDIFGNKVIRSNSYDQNGVARDLAYYLSLEKLGIVFTGSISLPSTLGTTQVRLRGDDGIKLKIGDIAKEDWNTKGIIENSKTITVDAAKKSTYQLRVDYFNHSDTANLLLEYRYKLGNKWSEWSTVPEEFLCCGPLPTVQPTLSFWDTRQTVLKLNSEMSNYTNRKCSDLIKGFAKNQIMSGITGFAQCFDADFYSGNENGWTECLRTFGTVAKTNIGKSVLDTVAKTLGISIGTLSAEEKSTAIKREILRLCHLQETSDGTISFNISYQDGILTTINILTFLEDRLGDQNEPNRAIMTALDNVLLYDVDPWTGEVYDPTNPGGEGMTLQDCVSSFFSIYGFAKSLGNMAEKAIDEFNNFNDQDRMKSFLFLCQWSQDHGISISNDILQFASSVKTANNATISAFISGNMNVAGTYDQYKTIRALDGNDLKQKFSEDIESEFGTSYMEAIYKQLLLDCMDNFMTYVYKVPDNIEWPF